MKPDGLISALIVCVLIGSACSSRATTELVSPTPLTSLTAATPNRTPEATANQALDRPKESTRTVTTFGDGEPTVAAPAPTSISLNHQSNDPEDVATRAAVVAFRDENWPEAVAADLHPNFAALLTRIRRPTNPQAGEANRDMVLSLVATDQSTSDPAIYFVSFDEVLEFEEVRHVTAVTLTLTNPPLVLDLIPVA